MSVPPAASDFALFLGPGPHSQRLASVLRSLGAPALSPLADLAELAQSSGKSQRLLLDANLLPREDHGLVYRWLRRTQGELVLYGDERGRLLARELLREARTRYLSWPLDLLDLEWLCQASHDAAPASIPQPAALSSATDDPELEAIEAILRGEPTSSERPDEVAEEEAEADFELDPIELAQLEPTSSSPPVAAATLEVPPSYFKDQVADLADIAQRIELSLELVGEADERAALGPLEDEVRRLVQFTRTLGYLVAPPGVGHQHLDLSELVEIFLSSAVSRADDAPRCLFRGGGPLPIRSDRSLLTQALDAFFFVAQHCAESGEIVRVQTSQGAMNGRPSAVVTIEFPAGPLSGLAVEQILSPYGLRRVLPALGPNALAAATGILAGQGGRALLERRGENRLCWRLELPRHAAAGGETSKSGNN